MFTFLFCYAYRLPVTHSIHFPLLAPWSFDGVWQLKALGPLTESTEAFDWEPILQAWDCCFWTSYCPFFFPNSVYYLWVCDLTLERQSWSPQCFKVILPCDSASAWLLFCSSPVCLVLLLDQIPSSPSDLVKGNKCFSIYPM